jgi:hypothetical protein
LPRDERLRRCFGELLLQLETVDSGPRHIEHEAATHAIPPPKALHDFVWTAGRDRACEDVDDVRQIVRMN